MKKLRSIVLREEWKIEENPYDSNWKMYTKSTHVDGNNVDVNIEHHIPSGFSNISFEVNNENINMQHKPEVGKKILHTVAKAISHHIKTIKPKRVSFSANERRKNKTYDLYASHLAKIHKGNLIRSVYGSYKIYFKESVLNEARYLKKIAKNNWLIRHNNDEKGTVEKETDEVGTVYTTKIGADKYQHRSLAGASDKVQRYLELGDRRPVKLKKRRKRTYRAERRGQDVKNTKSLKKKNEQKVRRRND